MKQTVLLSSPVLLLLPHATAAAPAEFCCRNSTGIMQQTKTNCEQFNYALTTRTATTTATDVTDRLSRDRVELRGSLEIN